MPLRLSTTACTPRSTPRLTWSGLAPAVTFLKPSATIAWASTVAVGVPSPAMSLVLVAASFKSWAPMFSNGSSSSISLAMVTPSFVMVGAPNFLSTTTLRPRGPSVTLTASARAFTPRSRARRASSSNSRIFAIRKLQTQPPRPDGQDGALLRLLLGRVGNDQARRGGLLGLQGLDHDPVLERLENNLGGG